MHPQPNYKPSVLIINGGSRVTDMGIVADSLLNILLGDEVAPDTLRKRVKHESLHLTSGMLWSESQPCTSISCSVSRALKQTWVLRESPYVKVCGDVRRKIYKLVVNYAKVKWLPAHHPGVTEIVKPEPIKSNMDHLIRVTVGLPISTSFLIDVDLGICDLPESMTPRGMVGRPLTIDTALKVIGLDLNWC